MYALNLDGSSWQELYRHACDRMAQLVPGWSDEIPSDPAVALLVLLLVLGTTSLGFVKRHMRTESWKRLQRR